ncbi:MAG TPA: DUF1697 domain-containing protein [Gemmatimonadota bacterium]|nr:DUF1697 domain-containing protein [Gemmatimonadota bacterium]
MSPASADSGAPRLAAFLRGINLGGRRVTNEELRAPFESLGLEDVATYRASGNVVFTDPGGERRAIERAIEEALASGMGFDADAFVRGLEDLRRLVDREALADAREEGFRPHVVFLRREPGAEALTALGELESPDDRFLVFGPEVVWLRRGRLSDSAIRTRHLEAALGGAGNTMRNLNTVERIVDKFG